ncbi:MAG: glycosyltransferase family 4 protein, partial [Sulfuricellaceae bacterium]|nr:glycosyltransferase family 4 protein [Sulfuricellaceae bacterium]
LKRIDRSRFEVDALFYNNYPKGDSDLRQELAGLGIPLAILAPRRQPLWAKAAKELARGLLGWKPAWRRQAVFAIEMAWRIRPNAKRLAEILRQGGYQLLYLNNQPSSNLEGYLAAEMAGVPVVQHCRIDATLNASEIAVTNRIVRRIVCVSHGVADSLKSQGIAADKCVVVNNAIDGKQLLPPPAALPAAAGGRLVVGAVGSLIKRKAVDHLLQAVARLGSGPECQVLVVGEGPQQDALEQLAAGLGLGERVTFSGFQKQALPWIAAMDVFVLASAKEGLPRVILEAMLLGKPVIASRVIGSKELVLDGETGFLYDYGDVDALAGHLKRLLADERLREAMGAAGRQRVLNDYSIERYVAGVEKILAEAAS